MKNLLVLVLVCICALSNAQEDSVEISSRFLKRNISVFLYDSKPSVKDKPLIYITDGKKMMENGTLNVLQSLCETNKTSPAVYVFVSTIDPITNVDYRNEYFFCNYNYLLFFEQELIPKIEHELFPLSRKRYPKDRTLIGISFGGLNAAYFMAKSAMFKNYALLSPITYPCPDLMKHLAFSTNKDLLVYLSTGTNDAENYIGPLKNLFENKGFQMKYQKTNGGHTFENWNGQLESALTFLIPR